MLLLVVLGAVAASCSGGDDERDESQLTGEWPMLSANLQRTGYNPDESLLNAENVADLALKWEFPTDGPVAASPVVATIDVPDEGPVRIVVVGSYDGNVYAIRAANGQELWRFAVKPHAGVSYGLIASSAAIAHVDGQDRVYVAGGETMYALDAATGSLLWEFDAGTGCTTCGLRSERNEILSSPAVLPKQDLVLFGMDVNDNVPGKGGFFALSAQDGLMRWYFDLESGATCRPDANDEVTRFDGYHAAADLGLAEDFFATRDGCDFDRTETGCGNVWSPVSVDLDREFIYFTSSNCDTDDDPSTPMPPPPMPLYDEALVVLHFDGTPAWTWRPREVDNDDLAFGAGANLFTTTVEGVERDLVGLSGKDGVYYLLDRDGENEITGEVEPYWERKVVEGGSNGGVTGTPAVMGDTVFFGTGISETAKDEVPAWALSLADGSVLWSQADAAPFFGATSATPGLVFMSGVDTTLRIFDAATGDVLASRALGGLGFSQAAIVGGEVFVGSGFGALGAISSDPVAALARVPASVRAFCVVGAAGCSAVAPELLFSPQDNQLDVYNLSTGEMTVLIPSDQYNVNGQVCLLPDGSGNFLMGEDIGQSEGARQGWGIFSRDGTLVDKIFEPVTPGEAEQPEPFGCAFDQQQRLFVTDIGTGSFDSKDGKLIVFFPPDYEESCVLETTLRTAGTIAIDDEGSVYLAETTPPGVVLRFTGPFATGPEECDSTPVNRLTFIDDEEMATPLGIAQAPNGNWYVASVFAPATIREYDTAGKFVRTIVEPGTGGTPAGLAVGRDGTIYYADLGIVERPDALPGPGPGEGTVRMVTFDADGNPNPPVIIGQDLTFPDAVTVLE